MNDEGNVNVLSDVGGVLFTFDKGLRKEIWTSEAGGLVQSVLNGSNVTDRYPGLNVNPYANHFDLGDDYNSEFAGYARAIAETLGIDTTNGAFCEEAGKAVLKGMLLDPTATALLEHIQGEVLRNGRLTAEVMPGAEELIKYVQSTGGAFKGYSTGASEMPNQFYSAIGLDCMINNTRTTFPGNAAKEKKVSDIMKEWNILCMPYKGDEIDPITHYADPNAVFDGFIDDNDNEVEIFLDAREKFYNDKECPLDSMREPYSSGYPAVYLFRKELSEGETGVVQTSKGKVVVVNNLAQIQEALRTSIISSELGQRESSYKIDFMQSDQKFG